MAIVATSIPEVNDIVEAQEERELWIVAKEHERPPYWSAEEGLNSRLGRAIRLVTEGHVTPNSDASYTVVGRDNHTYRVREHCSCPDSTYRKERGPCYHEVAVRLYTEWQRRLGFTPQGLPLGPASVEERIAQPVPHPAASPQAPFVLNLPEDGWVAVQPDGTPTPVTPTPAQEVLMTADADAYIPEPDAPVAVLEAPRPTSLPAVALEQAMAQWSAQRAVVRQFLKQELLSGTDYYTLQIKGRATKPVLSKAGSEKVLGLLQLSAHFTLDDATWTMLGKPEGTLCYVCQLTTTSGQVVGEGRGARRVTQDGGDLNKTIKMAQKSAQVDAVLRTGALSDCFTQDLDDEETPATPAQPTSADLRSRIWALVKAADATITTREACEAYVQRVTGMPLAPDNYGGIVAKLEQGR